MPKGMYGKERTTWGDSLRPGDTRRAPVPVQTLSRAYNSCRFIPSGSTKALRKEAKETKKQVIIPLLFLLIFLPKYQTLYYTLLFGGRTGRNTHLPDDCPIAGSCLDATEGRWARNLWGQSMSRSHVKWAPVFSETTLGYLHPYQTPFLPKIRCIKIRLNTFKRHFKKFALQKVFKGLGPLPLAPKNKRRKTQSLGYRRLNLTPSFQGNT